MRLHQRLGFLFGGILILVVSALAGVLYWQVRSTFVRRSAEQAQTLAELAVEQGGRRAKALDVSLSNLSGNIELKILMRDAARGGSAQRKLIDHLAEQKTRLGLTELTAIAPDGTVLARGHESADFGDPADSSPSAAFYLPAGSTVLRLRRPVTLQGRREGDIEAGMDMADFLSDVGKLFSGRVTLVAAADPFASPALPQMFQFVVTKPWTLSDGTVLADLVFSRTDEESRLVFRALILRAGIIFLIAMIAVALAVRRASDTVTRPVRLLAKAASEISLGNRRLNLPAPSRDEIGELTESFSRMAANLDESQKKLLAAERLAAWQDAARMLAHEIKNPLSPIKTTATTLSRATQDIDPNLGSLVDRGASTILNEIAHLEKLLSEFSAFARFPSPHPVPGDFNAAVKNAVEGFREKGKFIQWKEEYAANLPPALIDPGMFAEVVRNLLSNALDAAGSAPTAGSVIRIETSEENHHVRLTVADSGLGVSADKRRTLFTPYFTTKPGGTGLGLAVSRKIMIEHGGDLVLLDESPYKDARGAAFSAKLPTAISR